MGGFYWVIWEYDHKELGVYQVWEELEYVLLINEY